MKKTAVLSWLLLGSMILSACGGASAPAESSASTPPAQSLTQEPAQSAMAPVVTAPDVSAPDTSAPDVSVPDASSPDAGQSGGGTSAPEKKPQVTKPEPKPHPAPDQSQPATEPDLAPQPDAKPAPTKEAASAYIGKSVSSLIAAIGQPGGSDYAPSCLGDGEDGELFYDGFTVYTYRENGKETVQAVE